MLPLCVSCGQIVNSGVDGEHVDREGYIHYGCKTVAVGSFAEELRHLINKHSLESNSGTPDYILAEYLVTVLAGYEVLISKRALWRGESVNSIA